MPHWYVSEILFILHPSGMKLVMNARGFRFLTKEAKKLTLWAFSLSKRMMMTCLKAQFNAAVLPLYFIYGGVKYVYQSYHTESEVEQSPEPSSAAIALATRNLRSSVLSSMQAMSSRRNTETNSMASNNGSVNEQQSESLDSTDHSVEGLSTERNSATNPKVNFLGMNEFSGGDLLWDVPVIWKKAQHFEDSLKEKESTKFILARKALEEHPMKCRMPKTRLEYTNILNEARNGLECPIIPDSVNEDDSHFKNMVDSNISKSVTTALNVEIYPEQNKSLDSNFALSQHCQRQEIQYNCSISPRAMTMHPDMASTLRKLQAMCNAVIEGLTNVNHNLNEIILMRCKLNELEFKAEEMIKLYEECETERSNLEAKLSNLDRMINEEQRYLSDISSYESGFYDGENIGNSDQH